MRFLIYYKIRNKQNIAEQDKETETSFFYEYTRSFYPSMIRLQYISHAFKNFFLSSLLRHIVLFIIINVPWISNYTFQAFYILFYYVHFSL